MRNIMKAFISEESGQGMVEYGLILALVSVVVITTLASIGTKMEAKFKLIDGKL